MDKTRVNLIIPRSQAAAMISGHIAKAKKSLETPINNTQELQDARNAYRKWRDYAQEMLRQMFNNDSIANSMNRGGHVITLDASFGERVEDYRDDFNRDITSLESVEERLPLIPEREGSTLPDETTAKNKTSPKSDKVFVVHGRDIAAKSEVARFLEHIGLKPVILHEQANEGKTIIEKFESHASETGYAIVILSPDDLGSLSDGQDEARPRARQNVVFEWGYFVGRLGRERVSALYFKGVELPSDNYGVVYTEFDDAGAWQMLVARELKKAGFKVDLNDLV